MAQDSRTVICICIYLHYPNRRIKTVDALSNERVTGHRRCLPTVVITGLYRTGLGITVFQGIIYGNLAKARTGSVDGCSGFHSSVSLSSVVRLSQSLVSPVSGFKSLLSLSAALHLHPPPPPPPLIPLLFPHQGFSLSLSLSPSSTLLLLLLPILSLFLDHPSINREIILPLEPIPNPSISIPPGFMYSS